MTAQFGQEITRKERGLRYMNDVLRLEDETYFLTRYLSEQNDRLVLLNSEIASLSNIYQRDANEENKLNDLIETYSDEQKITEELGQIILEAQERIQAIHSGSFVKETRVACTAKALLDPKKFDNQELWKLLHENNIFELDNVLKSAEEIGFNHISDIQYCLNDSCPNVHVFYPDFSQFIKKLEQNCFNSDVIVEHIITSCLDLKEQQILRWNYTSAVSYPSTSQFDFSLIFDDNVFDYTSYNRAAYIGHFDNPFSEQFKCILNDQTDISLFEQFDKPLRSQSDNVLSDQVIHDKIVTNDIGMQILGLFINAVGIAAIAVAFTVLNASTLGIPGVVVAGVGLATTLGGLGLFKYSYDQGNQNYPKIQQSSAVV